MNIRSLELEQFRNYEHARFAFDPAVNLICGENGQGKTNLLEAAAACSTMRLFRTAQKKKGCASGKIMRGFWRIFRRKGAILHWNCVFLAQNPWKSIKTACGRNDSRMRRAF